MEDIILPLIYQIGTGGVLGFIVGYAIKKMMKLVAVIIGLFALALMYLGQSGIVNVNYDKLADAIKDLYGGTSNALTWLTPILANIPFAGTFIVGLLIGFKLG